MLIEIEKIVIKDRIRKDLGDLQELADDITANGLINPPVITPDTYELITGERRIQAMKLLGYKQVEVRPMAVKDAEHQLNLEISENEARKDFSKSERIDYARRLERIESLKAKERMSDGGKGKENFPDPKGQTRDIVATKLSIGSGKQYEKEKYISDNRSSLTPEDFADWDEGKLSTNKAFKKIKAEKELLEDKVKELEESNQAILNYEKLTDAIPELEDLVNTGIVTKDTALAIMQNLSEKEQMELLTSLDTTQKITTKEVQKYIDKIKQLETSNAKVSELETQISELKAQRSMLERKIKLNQEDSDKYNKLKSEIEFLTKQRSDLGRQIDSATELAGLTVSLQKLLEEELAPIKFKRCMEALDSSDVCVRNLEEIITKLDQWSCEMKKLLPNRYDDIVDVQ